MKVIFVGPSLHGVASSRPAGIDFRPPAAKGDVYRAVQEGADVIGLVDGYFESTAAVWHKEILHALTCGVRLLGAASIGALRAAECAVFGMTGVGAIYEGYADGSLEDDAEVALLHAPRDLGYVPLSEPLVNVRATLDHLRRGDLVDDRQFRLLIESASSIFYKQRTWKTILAATSLSSGERTHLRAAISTGRVDQKMIDARALVSAVELETDARSSDVAVWEFSHTSYFQMLTTQR